MKADFQTAMGYFMTLFVFTMAVWIGTWKSNKSVRVLLRAVVVAVLSAPIIPYHFGGRSTAESLPFAALFDPIQALTYQQLRAIGITWIFAVPLLWIITGLLSRVTSRTANRAEPNEPDMDRWIRGGLLGGAGVFVAVWLAFVSLYLWPIWLGRENGEFLNPLTLPMIALIVSFIPVLLATEGFIITRPNSSEGKLGYLVIFVVPTGFTFVLATYLLLMRAVIAWGHA